MADLSRFIGRLFARSYTRGIERYLIALGLPLLAMALTLATTATSGVPFFPLFTLSIIIAAAYGGTKPGLLAVAMSALLTAGIIMPPRLSFRIAHPEQLTRAAVFTVVATVIAVVLGAIRELQRKLDNERERWRITIAGIGDAVIATDRNGRVTFLNRAAESVTGWRAQEAIGRPLETVFRIINEQTRATVQNPARKVLDSGSVVGLANHTVLIRRDGSEIPIDDSAAPIKEAKGATVGVVLVFRDITERRKTEAALVRNEKLATVGRLAATIAHEINNPLESISNLLYLALSEPDLNETARGYLALAQRELVRTAHVTKQTLSFARSSDKREVVSICELADGILELYASRVQQKNIRLRKKYSNCGPAEAASSEVRQVIGNLLSNAIDAVQPGGEVELRVRGFGDGAHRRMRVTVADRGHGIDPANLNRVFEPFFTTKDHVGTGLGLWVSQQILARQGGCIRVRSRVGKGSVFIADWPIAERVLETSAAPEAEAQA